MFPREIVNAFRCFKFPGIFRTREIRAAKWCEKYAGVKHAENIWTAAQTFLFCFVLGLFTYQVSIENKWSGLFQVRI